MTTLLVVLTLLLVAAAAVPLAVLPLVNRVRPSIVVPLLAAGPLISAASAGVVLGLLCIAVLGQIPFVADLGVWSVDVLAAVLPVPPVVGVSGNCGATGRRSSSLTTTKPTPSPGPGYAAVW